MAFTGRAIKNTAAIFTRGDAAKIIVTKVTRNLQTRANKGGTEQKDLTQIAGQSSTAELEGDDPPGNLRNKGYFYEAE